MCKLPQPDVVQTGARILVEPAVKESVRAIANMVAKQHAMVPAQVVPKNKNYIMFLLHKNYGNN